MSSITRYQLYHNQSLYDITKTICVTSYSVCMLSKQQFVTSYPSVYNITPSIFMTSYPIHMLSPYCFHHNTTTIPDISPTIIDITATVSVSSHRWHTHMYQCMTLLMTSQQMCKSSHLAHIWHNMQFNHITFTLYDINDYVLWHHKHSIHDIRSPLYDNTSIL